MSGSAGVPVRSGDRQERDGHGSPLLRALVGAVAGQAMLSAASFAVGLLLIRRASDGDYGAYVVVVGLIALALSLQNALVAPVLGLRMPHLDPLPRGALIGALQVAQARVLGGAGGVLLLAVCGLWALGRIASGTALWLLAGALAASMQLGREFFRRVLFGHGLALRVARHDAQYALGLVGGAGAVSLWLGSGLRGERPMALSLGLAMVLLLAGIGLASAWRLARSARAHESWTARARPRLWADEIAPLALWSGTGAVIQWVLSQGQLYLVAAVLDVSQVASIAAVRTLLMPANLLSAGIGSMMLPRTVSWLGRLDPDEVRRRVSVLALGVTGLSLAYAGLLWWGRDWVFLHVLHRSWPQGETLLLLWAATVLVTGARDQLAGLVAAQGRFRALTLLTLVCALAALAAGGWALARLGVIGALVGLLVGEGLSLVGVIVLMRRPAAAPAR